MRLMEMASSAVCFLLVAGAGIFVYSENICGETVPANRQVDGIPAYRQCSHKGAVYSNDGVNTRTTSGGTGWLCTQGGGGYQCTEFARRYLTFRRGISSVPSGNAGSWCDSKLPKGLVKASTPAHGDIIVFVPGACGASATYGHVGVVDIVDGKTITIVEQNFANRRSCSVSCARCFLRADAGATTFFESGAERAIPGTVVFDTYIRNTRLVVTFPAYRGDVGAITIHDPAGRLLGDLTGRVVGGVAACDASAWPRGMIIVSVTLPGRVYSRIVFIPAGRPASDG